MAYSWFRLYTKIRSDPDMAMLTDHQFRIWINLLCLASDSKERGWVQSPTGRHYPADALARTLSTTNRDLIDALSAFEAFGFIETTDRGIHVLKFIERQYDKPSDQPEATSERKRKQRSRECHVDVTPMSRLISTDTDSDIENPPTPQRGEEYTADFEAFWKLYPRKVGKLDAYAKWKATLKAGAKPAELITAAERYAQERSGKDPEYTMHGKRFLGKSKPWRDYLVAAPAPKATDSWGLDEFKE